MIGDRDLAIGLVGNPNCGKTTLFNALTGARQKVGNWPGVTVDRKSGCFEHAGHRVRVIDLPGIYSLAMVPGTEGIDETIARDWILSGEAQVIVNIVDATSLERGLYLTAQLIELGVPMVLAVNMLDEARRFDLDVDLEKLAARLGCPVIGLVARRGQGVPALKDVVHAAAEAGLPPQARIEHGIEVERALADLAEVWPDGDAPQARGRMIKALEGDRVDAVLPPAAVERVAGWQKRLREEVGDDPDTLIAEGRYAFSHRTAEAVTRHGGRASRVLSDRIDRLVLHPLAGPAIFLAVLYVMFMVTINLGGAFVDFFDKLASTLLVGGLGALLGAAGAPEWLKVLLADGLGGGVQVVATFIPIIGLLYIFLSALEDSGYMARAAFLVDRYSRRLGLPGKAFVPLVVGFGCNVPAVMAARTLEQHRDRLMTAAMAPFMSCGARLAVYALFASAFFPSGGQNLVFGLYLAGIAVAVGTGLLLRHTVLKGEITPFMMELPAYRWPPLRDVLLHAWVRLKGFMIDAGQVIVLVIAVLGFLNSFGTDGSFGNQNSERSALAAVARTTAPLFTPLGIGEDNWPAVVGIVTGVFAKETIVGTLNALYAVTEKSEDGEAVFDLVAGLGKAFATIPENLAGLTERLTNPIAVKKGETVEAATLRNMARHFDGVLGAFAYLLFILLYVPCVATIGALKRETGGRWTVFVIVWTTGVAYGVASAVYQIGRFAEHPGFSALWLAGTLALLGLAYGGLRAWGRERPRSQGALA